MICVPITQVLRLLLDQGVGVNTQNGDGFTPLHVATLWGREGCARLLLERGADPAISDDDEMTPLDYALSEGVYNTLIMCSILVQLLHPRYTLTFLLLCRSL